MRQFRVWSRAVGCAFLSGVVVFGGVQSCGKDTIDFADLNGEVGNIPGQFNMRIAPDFREKIDRVRDQITNFLPGMGASLAQRFSGSSGSFRLTNGSERNLSDLFSLSIPGTELESVNQRIFSGLKSLSDSSGLGIFEAVDTDKFLNRSYALEDVDDTRFSNQYYLEMVRWQEAMALPQVDARRASAVPIVVAVLDTGVLSKHEDLKDALWNYNDIIGYDATDGSEGRELSADDGSSDGDGHGTHVAGIIGAVGKNELGIHGVAAIPRDDADPTKGRIAEIMGVKVLNDNGSGTSSMISNGIRWAVDKFWAQKDEGGARAKQKLVINMSLGGPFDLGGYSYETDSDGEPILEDDLFAYATSKDDVLIVVAAGNESCGIGDHCDISGQSFNKTYYYPCSYQNVLCVAATTHEEKLAGFSNRRSSVALAAPGWAIISTGALHGDTSGKQYLSYSGTSQATPLTSGVASVVWGLYPEFTAEQVKEILIATASPIDNVTAELNSRGGRVDLKAALNYAKQLADAGTEDKPADPAKTKPADGIVSKSKVEPENPPQTSADPDATSESATAPAATSRGKGSGGGCGVIGVSHTPGFNMMLTALLAIPLLLAFRKRQD